MFNKETREALVQIIAEGVALGMAGQPKNGLAVVTKKVEATSSVDEIEEDEFAEPVEGPTPEEIRAQKKSEAGKKSAVTRKRKAAEKKAAEAAAEMKVDDEAEDELGDELDDGEEPEMVEAPAMDRETFMATLKRYASKHPNGEKIGRMLASTVLKRDFDVKKFGELDDQYFEEMCQSLKEEIKSI